MDKTSKNISTSKKSFHDFSAWNKEVLNSVLNFYLHFILLNILKNKNIGVN